MEVHARETRGMRGGLTTEEMRWMVKVEWGYKTCARDERRSNEGRDETDR